MDVSLATEVMAIFVIFFACFGQNLVAVATSHRPLQSEMSSLDWSTSKTIPYNSCYTNEVMSIQMFETSLALCSKSRNDFCSFRCVIWLLTQCFKL